MTCGSCFGWLVDLKLRQKEFDNCAIFQRDGLQQNRGDLLARVLADGDQVRGLWKQLLSTYLRTRISMNSETILMLYAESLLNESWTKSADHACVRVYKKSFGPCVHIKSMAWFCSLESVIDWYILPALLPIWNAYKQRMCRVIKKHWNFWLGTNCKNTFISSFKCLIKKVMSLLLTRLTRLKIMILTPSDKKLLGALEAVRSRPLHQHGRPAALFRVFTIKHLHRSSF